MFTCQLQTWSGEWCDDLRVKKGLISLCPLDTVNNIERINSEVKCFFYNNMHHPNLFFLHQAMDSAPAVTTRQVMFLDIAFPDMSAESTKGLFNHLAMKEAAQ